VRVLVDNAFDVPGGILEEIAGIPVCVIEFPVEPLFNPDTTRYDEIPGGAQIEPAPQAAGTLGAIVRDGGGNAVGLTCHHVSGDTGTTLWQSTAPPIVVGTEPDRTEALGTVIAFESPQTQTIPVPAGPTLLLGRPVDAATVSLDLAFAHHRTVTTAIADGVGVVDATKPPHVGMFVRKRGSQTGPTGGMVVGIQLHVPWRHGTPPPGHAYAMSRQYELFFNPAGCPDGIFARGGDSGSLVLEATTQTAVGLLWGGVRSGGIRALMCDITEVETRLGISVA
jgi:hypothetical protein